MTGLDVLMPSASSPEERLARRLAGLETQLTSLQGGQRQAYAEAPDTVTRNGPSDSQVLYGAGPLVRLNLPASQPIQIYSEAALRSSRNDVAAPRYGITVSRGSFHDEIVSGAPTFTPPWNFSVNAWYGCASAPLEYTPGDDGFANFPIGQGGYFVVWAPAGDIWVSLSYWGTGGADVQLDYSSRRLHVRW